MPLWSGVAVHATMLAAMVPLLLTPSALTHVAVCATLVVASACLAPAARSQPWARGLIADLWAMAALCLLMAHDVTTGLAVVGSSATHHHSFSVGGPAAGASVVALWLAARLLLPGLRPLGSAWLHVLPGALQLGAMLAMPLLAG